MDFGSLWIAAAGEAQAATKLAEAAQLIQDYPVAIQLRYLQTVVEIAAENNSTTLFPIPMDLFKPIVEAGERFKALGESPSSPGDSRKTLGAEASDDVLPGKADQAMLADAARAFLGLGSGGAPSDEQPVPATQTEGKGGGEEGEAGTEEGEGE